ncbi:bifunctional (p)ppGpp synthetase/guanosine-3',5'-bis(diphosphate) 3'-pyrophosphohydrolase [Candidatus Peregrinibacteria bacterium]|nr:bifunctional (p)ppGpp synthetase/guanosine-3',5'-bis(diphosphate) 3'-pyrophosphohydrolase [Candidatus Peregrinibacteria bacterium]
MLNIDVIIQEAHRYLPHLNEERLRKAFDWVNTYSEEHDLSHDCIIDRGLEIASILVAMHLDEDSLMAAILCNLVEFGSVSVSDIESRFGASVAMLVQSLMRLQMVHSKNEDQELEIVRRMFLSLAKDLRVVFLKLACRLYDMRKLEKCELAEQKQLARETLDIFVPIAARLGMYSLKGELEDLSFRCLMPEHYTHIHHQLLEQGKMRKEWIDSAKKSLLIIFSKQGIEAQVEGRLKGYYSIYSKLKKKDKTSLDEIFDLFAIRVILPDQMRNQMESVGHLYTVLGIIHKHFVPLPRRFKDYVAVPKTNGYRSLHTTVLGLSGGNNDRPTEIQIRTQSMHQDAERGIAAHWLYKMHSDTIQQNGGVQTMEWISYLKKLQEDVQQNSEFMKDVRFDVFSDRIFVLTPRGQVKDLPVGATPIDFAYAVHSDVGHRAQMAKVNGSIVTLDSMLHNGDVVEILTKNDKGPNRYWLSFVKTVTARNKIKAWFRTLDRERNVREGRDILNDHLARLGRESLDPKLHILKRFSSKKLTFQEREDVLECIGNGTVSVGHVLKRIFSERELLASEKNEVNELKSLILRSKENDAKNTILVAGDKDIPLNIPSCCKPEEGSPIIGYITRGRGISVHSAHCRVVKNIETQRLIELTWNIESNKEKKVYPVTLDVKVRERIGLIRDVSSVITEMNISIFDFSIIERHLEEGYLTLRIIVEVSHYDQLDTLMYRLTQNINGVMEVKKADS